MLFEIKGLKLQRDLARRQGTRTKPIQTRGVKGARQLDTHRKKLEADLGTKLPWVQTCLVLPNYSAGSPAGLEYLEEAMRELALEPSEVLDRSQLGFEDGAAKHFDLYSWFKERLVTSAGPVDAGATSACQKLACWCLLHCTGILFRQLSAKMDGVLTHAEPPPFLSGGKDTVALLTHAQYKVYHSDCTVPSLKPAILILGGAGTGKTFVILEKLKKLHREGKLDNYNKGMFICFHANNCLMTQVSRPLNYCCWDNEMSL
jgi:hypothetical protein